MNKTIKSKKVIYTDEPIKIGKIVKDFLPRPEELSKAKRKVKVRKISTELILH